MFSYEIIVAGVALGFAISFFATKKQRPNAPGNMNMHTPTLALFSVDLTELAESGKIDPVVGREEEILRLTQILARRTKNNAILIGAPGVGKTAIIEGFAKRIVEGGVSEQLAHKRVISLDLSSLLSGTKYRGEFEERAKKIIKEIEQNGRSIILFIDEIHAIVETHGTEGAVNLADILKPALARGDLQMVGATTFEEYETYIKKDASLERRFQPVEVREPTVVETIGILHGVRDKFREYHKVEFTDSVLEYAARLSAKHIQERRLPDKAIDVLDEAASMVKVAHVHEDIPGILYEAAAAKHPAVKKLWSDVQALDARIQKSSGKKRKELSTEREKLEQTLQSYGILTVDTSDIEEIVKKWYKGITF